MRPVSLKKKKAQPSHRDGLVTKGEPLTRRRLFVRRFFHRAEARVETLPPFLGTSLSIAFIASFALYGLFLSGEAQRFLNKATAKLGFEVKTVSISGHNNLTEPRHS